MLVDILKRKAINMSDCEKTMTDDCILYVRGFLWSQQYDAQHITNALIREYKDSGQIPYSKLRGSFSAILISEDKILCFTDNSNMSCFYIGKHAISSSFLELLRYETDEYSEHYEFDRQAVAEYLVLGRIYLERTLLEGIHISDSGRYYTIDADGLNSGDKRIGTIEDKSEIHGFPEFFDQLVDMVSERNILLSQTGGYDSRMVHSLIQKVKNLKLFIQTNNTSCKDYTIARKVACLMDRELIQVDGTDRTIDESMIRDMFERNDGLSLSLSTSSVRTYDYCDAFLKNEFSLQITGDGGVLHKDWEWTQDIPFYNKKTVNLKKFYQQRIAFESRTKGLSKDIVSRVDDFKDEVMQIMAEMSQNHSNTQSYDFFYYYITGNRTRNYSLSHYGFHKYAPLLELELVRYSFHLPRHERFFYMFIRHIISRKNTELSRIPTNYGTTASDTPIYLARDAFFQIVDYAKKFYRMLYRKAFHKTPQDDIVWYPRHEDKALPMLEITQRALQRMKELRIIEEDAMADSIPKRTLYSLLNVYLVSEIILGHENNE